MIDKVRKFLFHLPSLPVTGGRNPYECTIEGMREVEHQSERDYERKIV